MSWVIAIRCRMICVTGVQNRRRNVFRRSIFCVLNFMDIQNDFKEWLESLNRNGVNYLIVGAYALAHHGVPRATGDLDIYVEPSPDNAQRLLKALSEFGFSSLGLTADDFLKPDHVVQLGMPPVRIDLMTGLSGVKWSEAWEEKEPGSYGGIPVAFIGRRTFVANKKRTGRLRDLADLESLEE